MLNESSGEIVKLSICKQTTPIHKFHIIKIVAVLDLGHTLSAYTCCTFSSFLLLFLSIYVANVERKKYDKLSTKQNMTIDNDNKE